MKFMVFKAIFVMLLISNVINAEGSRQMGLTGGTKGVGFKYMYPSRYFELDFGFPFYYAYDKRTGDTVEWNHNFQFNPYFGFSANIIKFNKNEIYAGIAFEPTVGYQYKNASDTVKEKRLLIGDPNWGPILHYVRKNHENERIFSFELFPIHFQIRNEFKKTLSFSPNVQICVYIK